MLPLFPLDVPEVRASSAQSPTDSNDPHAEVKDFIRGFLNRSDYKSPQSPCDAVLRKRLSAKLAFWPADINAVLMAKIMDGSCVYAETTYGHTTHEHRYFIALYTVCLMYVDDLGERDLDADRIGRRKAWDRTPISNPLDLVPNGDKSISVDQYTAGHYDDVREVLRDFLKRSMVPNDCQGAPGTRHSAKMYQDIFRKIADVIEAAGDDPVFVEKFSTTGCDLAEIIYGHTSPEHQHYIALYTACFLYADDLGSRHVDAVGQFSRRFASGQRQLHPVLDTLTELMRQSYELWPPVGADAIISGTLEAIAAMYVECTTSDMKIAPQATWWPNYFRTRTGICPPYAHFNFMKSWRATPDSYLQLLPYLEFHIVAANDVLSFYKEELVGETKNYIHIRATTDQSTPINTLRVLADEVLGCMQRAKLLIGDDQELMKIWHSFEQGVLDFHVQAQRYRLAELTLS